MNAGKLTKIRLKVIGKILAAFLLLACLISISTGAAVAAGPGEVTFNVKQVFTSIGTPPSNVFNYLLTPKLPANPMPVSGVDADGSFIVTGTADKTITLNYTQAGVYEYEISLITPAGAGYILDREVYSIKITTHSDLTCTVIIRNKNGDKVDEYLLYAHSYDDDGTVLPSDPDVMVDPPVKKTVLGNPPADGIFTFRLAAGNPSNPMPVGSVNGVKIMTIVGPGEEDFGTWIYTAPGIYFYTISEVNNGVDGYAYDTMVYTITDTVTAVDGQLVVSRVVANNFNRPVTSFAFINTYSPGIYSPGSEGPKTGDDTYNPVYLMMFIIGSVALASAAIYLSPGRKRKMDDGSPENV